jgi:GAF domain-containing protein
MFDFRPNADTPPTERYRQLCQAADALTQDESDAIANMANCAALIWEFLPDLNWAGFYRMVDSGDERELVLGPFIGRPACIRIALGRGVCGTAALQAQTQLVEDVHKFPGHIPCDAASNSELVVPVLRNGEVIAVIDCDSPLVARFTAEDAAGLESLAELISDRI